MWDSEKAGSRSQWPMLGILGAILEIVGKPSKFVTQQVTLVEKMNQSEEG